MFSKKETHKSPQATQSVSSNKLKLDTMVGPNTELNGDIKFENYLVVDGVINGNVNAEDNTNARIALNKTGRVIGDIKVPNIYIDGQVEGDVYATGKVELANGARINGNVHYNLIEMEMGASLNGNLVHQPAVDTQTDAKTNTSAKKDVTSKKT